MSVMRGKHAALVSTLLTLVICGGCERGRSNEQTKAMTESRGEATTGPVSNQKAEPSPSSNMSSQSEPCPTSAAEETPDVGGTWALLADPAWRAKFLESRRPAMVLGSFDSMVSLWYAVSGIPVSCESRQVAETVLWTNFPEFYEPTWTEYFNAIARQTHTHWYYKDERYGFMFVAPPLALPFTVQVADGWRTEHYGHWVKYVPQQAPVGMDIYMLGEYSVDSGEDQEALFNRVRREWALAWAQLLDPDCTLDNMKTVQVAGVDALFFEGQHSKTQVLFRQWILVKRGMCFAIFSAVKPELESQVWPDVQKMVRSFDVDLSVITTQGADSDAG